MADQQQQQHTSLLTAVDCRGHVHLVIGVNPLAAARCSQSLAVGAAPVLVAPKPTSTVAGLLPAALQIRVDAGEVRWVQEAFCEKHLFTLGREAIDHVADAVFVTEDQPAGSAYSAAVISATCLRSRIPINVVDRPRLCSFSLLSAHTDGPLQVGVTTNGSGCRLAARIRREIAATLPAGLGAACSRLGALRRRIQEEDRKREEAAAAAEEDEEDEAVEKLPAEGIDDDAHDQSAAFNRLVLPTDPAAAKTRRARWLAQVCEYWPLRRLAAVTDADAEGLLKAYGDGRSADDAEALESNKTTHDNNSNNNNNALSTTTPSSSGRIILAGSGPGHPDLLTRAVLAAIQQADLVLADKLVPQGVLDLIPRRTPTVIARKFPGNADAAQEELLQQAVTAARAGQTVLRLKQGDPFVYGRGGEEVLRLREAGFTDPRQVVVLPGVTSALSAPLFAGIPPTHRDAADQVLICTGTGKKGKPPQPPGYRPARTAVFLMALHRIAGLVAELTAHTDAEEAEAADANEKPPRTLWPASTPCAVVERASCPDQKVIRTTLAHVAAAIEQEGSRPPGLLVVGRACGVLHAVPGAADAQNDKGDGTAATADRPWTVEEGFAGFNLDGIPAAAALAGLA